MKSLIVKLVMVMSVYIITGCSDAGKVTIHDVTLPSAPAGLSGTVTSATSIALNWNESIDNVGVAGYRVYRDGSQIADIISTSCTDTGLVSSTTYSYTVAAYDAADNVSDQSSVISIRIFDLDSTPPSIPTGLSGTATSSSVISLNWNESTDNVGVAGYRVYRDGVQIADTISTSCTDTGLAYGTTYGYTVSAYDATGNMSAQTSSIPVTTLTLNITGGSSNNNMTIFGSDKQPVGGANDVLFTSDGTLKTSVSVSGQVSNATLSSTCPFISMRWTAHDVAIYGTGIYTVYTGCPAGSPGCGTGEAITFTVGAGEIGGHMLFDWSTYKNMDVVIVWQPNEVFAPSLMQTDNCGTNPADTVWGWMSKDIDGDGINGHAMVEGISWAVNFNLH